MHQAAPANAVAPEDCEALLERFDLDAVSLRDVYKEACAEWKRPVNRQVVSMLPDAFGAYEVVAALDLSRCYLGAKGLAPLLPVVACCERLQSLSLRSNGLRTSSVAPLIELLHRHPSLRELDLSGNELCTAGGKLVLNLVRLNRRLVEVAVEDALVIPALQRKIAKELAANRAAAAEQPLISFRYIKAPPGREEVDPEVLAAEQAAREERHRQRQEILDTLPYWMPAALTELSQLFYIHRDHMVDVIALFPAPSDTEEETDVSCEELTRVLKIMGCRFINGPPDEARVMKLPEMLGCVVGGRVRHEELVALLRTHTCFDGVDSAGLSANAQAVLDAMYDTRDALSEMLDTIEVERDVVQAEELRVGLVALRVVGASGLLGAEDKHEAVCEIMEKAGVAGCETVAWRSFLQRLQAGEAPSVRWDKATASTLRMLRERLVVPETSGALIPASPAESAVNRH